MAPKPRDIWGLPSPSDVVERDLEKAIKRAGGKLPRK